MELSENTEQQLKFSGLRSEMAKFGHKYSTIAKLLNLTESSVSRRFSGEIAWSFEEIETICNFYNKDYYQLFT